MKLERRKAIQIVLVIAFIAAAVRVGVILYERKPVHEPEQDQQQERLMNLDYYVTPKKLHAYDLNSARELTKQPVWCREGYRYSYYPYNAASHKADLNHVAGQLGPIERLSVTGVVAQPEPGSAGKAVLATFEKNGQMFAVPIGSELKGDYNIYADEIFYIQDPKELYKHWPADIWQAIEEHQVKPGMNEIQTAFAIGMGVPHPMNGDEKTVDYPNGGNPLRVTFRSGTAVEIGPKPQS
jgi:hypothetical protein